MKNVQSAHRNQNHPLHSEKKKKSQIIFPSFLSSTSNFLQQRHNRCHLYNRFPITPNTIHWMCIGRNLHWQLNVSSLFRQTVVCLNSRWRTGHNTALGRHRCSEKWGIPMCAPQRRLFTRAGISLFIFTRQNCVSDRCTIHTSPLRHVLHWNHGTH